MTEIIRIANCSGYYGDKLDAARQLIEGGDIDVLTGDYLAELTMSILHNQRRERGREFGYVGTFLKQVEDVAALCLDRGIKIVVNAGGLNPKGMADEVKKILLKQNLAANVAYIDGDDLIGHFDRLYGEGEQFKNLDSGLGLENSGQTPVTANIYFGAWAIKEALDLGADIVICPRVTDAALVIGPAAWKFNWKRNDYDALAGALTAGHIIECGAQCCGGNFSFFQEVPSFRNVGYPIAEIEADGSFTITKHPNTGGLVSIGTVTAQLLYEISSPEYLNPDVIAHFDTLSVEQIGVDRVRVSGVRGSSPPPTHKVCINTLGLYKQSFEVFLTGLDIEQKAEIYLDAVFCNLGGREQFHDVDVQLLHSSRDNPVNEAAYSSLRVTVTSKDPKLLGRIFSAKITELALASVPGIVGRAGGGEFIGGQVIVHWPALIDSSKVTEQLHLWTGEQINIAPTQQMNFEEVKFQPLPKPDLCLPSGPSIQVPLGRLFGSRSGDKGGAANCGVWAKTDSGYAFLENYLTVEELKRLCPDLFPYHIQRYELPNLRALNFFIKGLLGEGVSSNHRIDKQAKSLGEYLASKSIKVPKVLIEETGLSAD